jgi:hypothetical protein
MIFKQFYCKQFPTPAHTRIIEAPDKVTAIAMYKAIMHLGAGHVVTARKKPVRK